MKKIEIDISDQKIGALFFEKKQTATYLTILTISHLYL